MKELRKQLKKIEETWGIKAYREIEELVIRMQISMDEIRKSRETWKRKYMDLKEKVKD